MSICKIYMIQFLRLFFGGFIMRDKLAYEWGIPIAISLLAVGARYCINADRASFTGIIRAAIIGVFVGIEVNLYLLDSAAISPEIRGAIVGVS